MASKPVVWIAGEVRSPPFSTEARLEAGGLLRQLQNGETLGLPRSRPMPSIGAGCHELRIRDEDTTWRIFYHLETDAVVVLEVEKKATARTPQATLVRCKGRLRRYKQAAEEA